GLGFEIQPSPFGLFVGHTGAVEGGTAGLAIHVETGTVLALTTNLGYATAVSPPPRSPAPPTRPGSCCRSSARRGRSPYAIRLHASRGFRHVTWMGCVRPSSMLRAASRTFWGAVSPWSR